MSGIYVHIPFCRQRCSYCDFYFVTGSRKIERFIDAVCLEIARQEVHEDVIDTVYFGGGTPSRFSVGQLERIVGTLRDRFQIAPAAEVTIEVNPEDPDPRYLLRLLEIGFNRLSIGVQSVETRDLKFMRRGHTAEQSSSIIVAAREAGFSALSIDLIFGLPGQSMQHWLRGVEFALEHEIPHISTYGLTVEPKTLLDKWIRDGQVDLLNQDQLADMYVATIDRLVEAGYAHYEISSFARPSFRSRHNTSYWRHHDYIGFGPSAHSFRWSQTALRWANVRNLARYLDAIEAAQTPIESTEELSGLQLAQEHVMLALRTADGVDRGHLNTKYGFRFSDRGEQRIADLEKAERIIDSDATISLTTRGKLVADAIASRLCDEVALTETDGPA